MTESFFDIVSFVIINLDEKRLTELDKFCKEKNIKYCLYDKKFIKNGNELQ